MTTAALGVCGTTRALARPTQADGSGAADKDPAYRQFLQTNYLFNRGLWDLAIPQYEKLLREHPDFADASLVHYAIALCHQNLAAGAAAGGTGGGAVLEPPSPEIRKKHLTAAVEHLKQTIRDRAFDQRLEATRLLGQAFLDLGETTSAAKAFAHVVERSEEPQARARAGLGLGESLYQAGRHDDAAAALEKVVADSGAGPADRERARFYLGMALYRAGGDGASERALQIFREAEKSPDSPHRADATYMAALVLTETGRPAEAVPLFEKLARVPDPNAAKSKEDAASAYEELALYGLASALLRLERAPEAAAALERFAAAYPTSTRRSDALLLLAQSHLASGEAARALALLEELRSSPEVGDRASLLLARELGNAGAGARAAAVVEAALTAHADSPLRADLELELGLARLAAEKFDEAAALFETFASTHPAHAELDHVAYLRAYALHRGGHPTPSRAACRDFRERHSGSEYLLEVIRIEAENGLLVGDYAAARKAYDEYLEAGGETLDAASVERARLRLAQTLYQDQKYGDAIAILDRIGDPKSTGGALALGYHFWLGDCSYQLGDDDRAADEFASYLRDVRAAGDDAAALASQTDDARFKLAHALQRAGKLAGSRAAYTAALKANQKTPYRERVLFELGQVAYSGDSPSIATKSFRLLLRDYPATRFAPHALLYLGAMDFDQGDFARAASWLQKVVDEHPQSEVAADAMYRLAISLRTTGDADGASAVLRRLEKEHPDDPRLGAVLLDEAAALSRAGKSTEALERLGPLREMPSLAAQRSRVLYEIAWCHRALGDGDAAVSAYRDSLAAIAERAEGSADAGVPDGFADTVRLELAELEFDREGYAAARDLLLALSEVKGARQEDVLYRLCWSHHKLGDTAATLAVFTRFEKDYPKSGLWPELAFIAAKTLLGQENIERASELFARIAQDFPERPEAPLALVSVGECQCENRRWQEARATFEKVLGRYLGSDVPGAASVAARARFGIGWARENLGETREAIKHYREVVESTSTVTAARAQFQIGQCEVAAKDHRAAIVEFLKVPATYDYPEWSARSLLQTAGCFEALGDVQNAVRHYREVVAEHGDRDEAKLATERLRKLKLAAPDVAGNAR